MAAPIKILVVDDHPLARQGLVSMLQAFEGQFQVVAEAVNGEEALLKVACAQPDVVVTDLQFAPRDPTDGIDLVAALHRNHPQVKVLMITAEPSDANMLLAHAAGASAFLSKLSSASEIAKAIDALASGFSHFPSRLREVQDKQNQAPSLTERECQLLPLIAKGFTAKEIARELTRQQPDRSITDRTVEIHKSNIKRKFDLSSAGLIAFAIDWNKKVRK